MALDELIDDLSNTTDPDVLPGTVQPAAESSGQATSPGVRVQFSSDAVRQRDEESAQLAKSSGPAPDPGALAPYSSDAVLQTQRHADAHAESDQEQSVPMSRKYSGATITGSVRGQRDWRRDRHQLDKLLARSRVWLLALGCLGTFFAVVANELIFFQVEPTDSLIEGLKLGNLLVSLLMLVLFVRHYMMVELMQRLELHLRALVPLNTGVGPMASLRTVGFWLELAVCLPCLPPGCTFEYVNMSWSNTVMYRAETLFCVYNSFRVYLIWPVLRDYFLDAFPRRHTIASFTHTRMDSAFAFKCIMQGPTAIMYTGLFWIIGIFLTGYWFRAAEVTACFFNTTASAECNQDSAKHWVSGSGYSMFEKTNDMYIWNALWGVFITGASVGYGDILASTHLGRIAMLLAAMVGLISVAALTAAISLLLRWNEEEQSALLLIKREQARRDLHGMAIKLIQCWIRKVRHKEGNDARASILKKMWHAKKEFRQCKLACEVESRGLGFAFGAKCEK